MERRVRVDILVGWLVVGRSEGAKCVRWYSEICFFCYISVIGMVCTGAIGLFNVKCLITYVFCYQIPALLLLCRCSTRELGLAESIFIGIVTDFI